MPSHNHFPFLLQSYFLVTVFDFVALFADEFEIELIVLLFFIQKKDKSNKEGFSSINFINNNYQPPKSTNPLMNVDLTDYKENPQRKSAAPSFNPIVEEKINENNEFWGEGFTEWWNVKKTYQIHNKHLPLYPHEDIGYYNILDYKFEYGDVVMLEQYIKGKEIQVAVLDGKALGTMEIKLLKRRFYDYDTKYKDGYAEHLYPGRITEQQIEEVKLLAEKANRVVGASGITRVEFILSERDHQFYLLEINTHPGFTPLSICPEIAKYNNINFDQLVKKLVETAKYES